MRKVDKSKVNSAGNYTKPGKQFVKQPKKIAEKTAKFR